MHVVRDAADALREAAEPVDRAAEVLVQTRGPGVRDERFAALRAEDDVVMEAEVGRGHRGRSGLLASLPGCDGFNRISHRRWRFAYRRLMAGKPSACDSTADEPNVNRGKPPA